MRNRTGWILTLACVLIFSGHARLRAQVVDKAAGGQQGHQGDGRGVGWLVPGVHRRERPEAMAPQRVLRWQNGTRGTQESDGVFVLWVNKGRPEASASIFPYEGSIPRIRVTVARNRNWLRAKTAA